MGEIGRPLDVAVDAVGVDTLEDDERGVLVGHRPDAVGVVVVVVGDADDVAVAQGPSVRAGRWRRVPGPVAVAVEDATASSTATATGLGTRRHLPARTDVP